MIGESIGNFVVKSRLGRGGMGEVFLAEHKDLQTPVAIKVLNGDISEDRDHVQRFFNEARIVSKIKHAGTIKIFDSGYFKGNAYLVMELLEGESLAARMDKAGPMQVAELLDIAQQIASVLDATHRQGVIHRDLKPDNIYLVHDDERASGERVKILDFGIAKLSGTLAGASPKTSGTMGTPTYMAPEQWGDSSKVDWRADAYSLGCVAFEMACGRPPFVVETIPEAYAKHCHEAAPMAHTLRADLPAELDRLLARLLAKGAAERATSMGEVASAFAAIAGRRISTPVVAVQGDERSAPVMRATPQPTMTTLGGSAVEMQTVAKSKRLAIGGGIAAGLVVLGVVIFAMTRKTDEAKPKPPEPVATPAPVVVVPDAAPVVVAPPIDAAPVVVTPPADAAAVVAAPAPPTPTPIRKKTVKKVTSDAGVPVKPPGDDDQWGGRL